MWHNIKERYDDFQTMMKKTDKKIYAFVWFSHNNHKKRDSINDSIKFVENGQLKK